MAELRNVVGKNIKTIRKAKKWTQAQLAEKVGLEPVSIARIETGLNFPKEENLTSIAKALNVSVSDLFVAKETDKRSTIKYIQSAVQGLDKRDLEIISNLVKTMSCC